MSRYPTAQSKIIPLSKRLVTATPVTVVMTRLAKPASHARFTLKFQILTPIIRFAYSFWPKWPIAF